MQKRIRLYPTQHEFVSSSARFAALIGGVGSGKTYAGCAKVLAHCDRPGLGLVAAPSYPMMRDATLRTFREMAGPAISEFRRSEMRAVVGEAEVLFRSADDPERLRGPNLSFAYLDEAALCDGMTWSIIIGRLREGEAGPCWITTTPKGRNWVWREFVQERRPGYQVFRAHTADNPHLPDGFLGDLEASYSGDFARQELLGEFVTFRGLVYEEFARERHVTADVPADYAQVFAGVDWGFTNPSVVLVVGFDGDGRACVLDEWYERRRLIHDVVAEAERLRAAWGVEMFLCDPSEPANVAEMQKAGLPALGVGFPVVEGIRRVKARLAEAGDGRTRLLIHPRCVNLVAELENYCWRTRGGEPVDEPVKANDHAADCLRYVVAHYEQRGVPLGQVEQPVGPSRWGVAPAGSRWRGRR